MDDVKVCRICLVMDVKMQHLQSYPLNTYLEPLLSGSNLMTISNSPPYACYECAELIKKFYFFKQKFLRSQAVLYGLIDVTGKVMSLELKQIDRQGLLLSSNLSKVSVTIENITYSDAHVKEETENEDERSNIYKAGSINGDECELLCPERSLSSDDDEPLSVQKKKKIEESKECKKAETAIEGELEEPLCKNEELEATDDVTDACSPVVIVRKRGRPKKHEASKKRIKRTIKSPYNDIGLDLGVDITVINLSVEEQLEEINKRKETSNYLNSPYQCNLCYKGFIDTQAWKHHVSKHSLSAGDVECPICKFRFKTKRALQKHSSIHEKKYACKSCPYISSNTTQAKQHQGWHKGVTYKCKFCADIFTVWTSYMSHVRIKHPSEFICGICGYSYISKLGLAMHKTMMHKDIMEKGETVEEEGPYCEECDVKFVSVEAFKRHMVMSTKHTRSTKTINGCRTCGETFKNAEDLRVHHRKEHARKRPKNYGKKPPNMSYPAKCEHCSEEIPNGREHWFHYRRMHPDKKYPIQKNYVCDICGKSFRANAFLVYHKRTHAEERAFKCNQCDKAFFNRTNLQVHQKTHSETRPYPCSVCFKAFKCKGALNRHFRSHTGNKPYECEVCGKAFTQSNSRKVHVYTVHLKQPAPYVSRKRNKLADKEPQSHTQFLY
ncbi:unnamed protein product [Arctia plantaginis]|uniref:C2H2-type domain-containing protein n=1 Tax=Arctia plantaginis TaxID=874455 RepID=A0A8S1B627_ARCPL|nr:unnamed protein product [Arctia plantaginis]CAB3253915.1 unnamed protein product [Arctia plantaginis]